MKQTQPDAKPSSSQPEFRSGATDSGTSTPSNALEAAHASCKSVWDDSYPIVGVESFVIFGAQVRNVPRGMWHSAVNPQPCSLGAKCNNEKCSLAHPFDPDHPRVTSAAKSNSLVTPSSPGSSPSLSSAPATPLRLTSPALSEGHTTAPPSLVGSPALSAAPSTDSLSTSPASGWDALIELVSPPASPAASRSGSAAFDPLSLPPPSNMTPTEIATYYMRIAAANPALASAAIAAAAAAMSTVTGVQQLQEQQQSSPAFYSHHHNHNHNHAHQQQGQQGQLYTTPHHPTRRGPRVPRRLRSAAVAATASAAAAAVPGHSYAPTVPSAGYAASAAAAAAAASAYPGLPTSLTATYATAAAAGLNGTAAATAAATVGPAPGARWERRRGGRYSNKNRSSEQLAMAGQGGYSSQSIYA